MQETKNEDFLIIIGNKMGGANSNREDDWIIGILVSVGTVSMAFLIIHLIWTRRYRQRLMRQERAYTAQTVRQRELARQRVAEERAQRLEHSRIREVEAALENFDISSVKTESCCAVCLERLDEKSEQLEFETSAVAIAPCLHVLHLECWRAWLIKDNSKACPICRVPVTSTNAAEIRTRSDFSERIQSPRSLSRVDALSNTDSHPAATDDLAHTAASAAATGSVTEPVSMDAGTTSPRTTTNDAAVASDDAGSPTCHSLPDTLRPNSDSGANDVESRHSDHRMSTARSSNTTNTGFQNERREAGAEPNGEHSRDVHIKMDSGDDSDDGLRDTETDPP